MQHATFRVDNAAHLLYFGGRAFPCDREVVAAHPWKGHAMLLSADTDCLSLWDMDGLVRLTRVGVYPQDLAVTEDTAVVCGGADGRLHLLNLPDLFEVAEYPAPGMPERLCLRENMAYVLSLIPEPEVHTMLVSMALLTGEWQEVRRFAGIPEAIAADKTGLRVVTSEGVFRLQEREVGI